MLLSKKELLLGVIILFAMFFRVYHINHESLWLDEGISLYYANMDLPSLIKENILESHPPLYYFLLHFWIRLFGDSEFAVRLLSAIFGGLSVLMIFKVGRLIFDDNVGILSSLLLSFSLFHIRYSQEARNYALLALLGLISFYYLISLLKKKSYMSLFGYIVSTTLVLYTHIVGLFILMAQNIYVFTQFILARESHELRIKRWILIQAIVFFLFAPWVWIVITHMSSIRKLVAWIPTPSLRSLVQSFIEYSGSNVLLVLFLVLLPFSLFKVKSTAAQFDWKNIYPSIKSTLREVNLSEANSIYLLLVWISTPIIVPFLISIFLSSIYLTKATIVASLAYYILISKGLNNIGNKYIKMVTVSIIIVLSVINIKGYYSTTQKEQWRETANFIEMNANNGDLLLFNSGTCLGAVYKYYSRKPELKKMAFPEESKYVDEQNIKKLDEIVNKHKRVWLILSHSGDSKGLILEKLGKLYNRSLYKKYNSIKIYLFESK